MNTILQDGQKIDILQQLEEKKITIDAAGILSKEMKDINATKEKFLKKVSFKSWQEAEEKVPRLESKLKLFNNSSDNKDFLVSHNESYFYCILILFRSFVLRLSVIVVMAVINMKTMIWWSIFLTRVNVFSCI